MSARRTGGSRCCAGVTWRCAPASSSACSAPMAPARPRRSRPSPASLRPTAGRILFDGPASRAVAREHPAAGHRPLSGGPARLPGDDRRRRTSRWAPMCAATRPGRGRTWSACSPFPRPRRAPAPVGRHAVGRRAADAGDRARAHGAARGSSCSTSRRWDWRPPWSRRRSRSSRRSGGQGTTVLMVEQNAYIALRMADRGLRDGNRTHRSRRGRPRAHDERPRSSRVPRRLRLRRWVSLPTS